MDTSRVACAYFMELFTVAREKESLRLEVSCPVSLAEPQVSLLFVHGTLVAVAAGTRARTQPLSPRRASVC